ncbi:MAG TPA: integrase core domain-containing protein [bacterium]|nr:integrase core domain-containing protein [bacterium]HPW05976.1 integrase core domain-containing protein [bacterium]
MRTRNTTDNLIAMKTSILDLCIARRMSCTLGAQTLKMHIKSFSRLKSRYQKYGKDVLIPKKPGPKRFKPANRTSDDVARVVCDLAVKRPDLGPIALRDELEELNIHLHPTTVWRILKRNQIRYTTTYKRWKPDPKLYCLETPGEELQLDACYPYGRSRKLTCFDAIDDCSRKIFARLYDRETIENAIMFVSDLVKNSPFRIQRIRADNRYKSKLFINHCNSLGIEVIINEPYTPEQNGKIERFHKTLKRSFFWKYCSFYDSNEYLQLKLNSWVNFYNSKRKHYGYGMNGMTPDLKIASSLFNSLNIINTYPQKVTLILQQYIFSLFC